ncbi:MAG: hypothetical protein JXR73_20710 [Candidatus Omnitrophica bacterium]|nr:hypothetical protein [Candidatus Omnitrophota bacterium]
MKNLQTFCFLLLVVAATSSFAQDRFIDCRKFDSSITIVIDGDGGDWPLTSYGSPALLDSDLNVIRGDHFIIDPETANYDNQDNTNAYEGPEDIDATTYIGWDDEAFFVLNIVTDDKIGFEHANADTIDADGYLTGASTGWTNDGIEFWLDNDNNREPPNIQDDQTSPNDLQFNVLIDDALQRLDYPDIDEFDIGMTPNYTFQYKEIFRCGADFNDGGDLEYETLDTIETATIIDEDRKGYTMEIRIPWGTFYEFNPDAPIGFSISWTDWDDGEFSHWIWHGTVDAQTSDYKEMRFTSDNPLGGVSISTWSIY